MMSCSDVFRSFMLKKNRLLDYCLRWASSGCIAFAFMKFFPLDAAFMVEMRYAGSAGNHKADINVLFESRKNFPE